MHDHLIYNSLRYRSWDVSTLTKHDMYVLDRVWNLTSTQIAELLSTSPMSVHQLKSKLGYTKDSLAECEQFWLEKSSELLNDLITMGYTTEGGASLNVSIKLLASQVAASGRKTSYDEATLVVLLMLKDVLTKYSKVVFAGYVDLSKWVFSKGTFVYIKCSLDEIESLLSISNTGTENLLKRHISDIRQLATSLEYVR